MNLFNAIFNTPTQAAASKSNNLFDHDTCFVNITCRIKKANDYNCMMEILKAIKNFKIRYQNNPKIKDDVADLENRLEARFEMLEAAGL